MRRFRGESGANAVEFALVLPILLILVMGMLWGGLAFNRQLSLTQSAREGARFGATLPYPADSDWLDDVEERVRTSIIGQFGYDDEARVCVRAFGGDPLVLLDSQVSGPADASDPSCSDPTPRVAMPHVEVWVANPATFDYVFGGGTIRLRAEAVARHEGIDE